MKFATLFISYNGLDDPLTHSQVVAYQRELAARGIAVHLLTFEWQLNKEQQKKYRDELGQSGITWHNLRYHKRPTLLATLYDIAQGTWFAWRICRKHNIQLIHARNHVPGAMALLLQRIFGYRWIFDLRGLMAEEYVDGGNWKVGDYKYHLVKKMERAFFRNADKIVMLTEKIKEELKKTEPTIAARANDITVIPCCVDTERFNISVSQREVYRLERGWQEKKVIVYAGKLGMWYLTDEMARFFSYIWQRNEQYFFQVLTQSDPRLIEQALYKYDVPARAYDIRFVPREQLPEVLTSCDIGLSFIRSCYSKLSSSPTKNAEYLAAGLPLVINAGIGDSDDQVRRGPVGVVVNEFVDTEYLRVMQELENLWAMSNCRAVLRKCAEEKFSLKKVGASRYASIYAGFYNGFNEGK